jgi:flagellar biosynthesis protein FlhF
MQPIPFIAETAEEAVAQIRAKLGPEAVVLNVRRLPANGLARLWQKEMIEVLAHRPEPVADDKSELSAALADVRHQLNAIKQQVEQRPTERRRRAAEADWQQNEEPLAPDDGCGSDGGWQIGRVLRKSGLLALHAQLVLDRLRDLHGEAPPASLGEEINLTRSVLASLWRRPGALKPHSLHVMIGAAGSGKTTCLCKWLTQETLVEGRMARVWRLDGATANVAESLSVYCEILGVPIERQWQAQQGQPAEDIGFLDLPGIDWREPLAVKELAGRLKEWGSPQIHLVVNGAYDIANIFAQARAFSGLPIADLIVTHLDEEPRWGKIWNLVLGTNYSIRSFATGQNVPGDFLPAVPELVLRRQFPRK